MSVLFAHSLSNDVAPTLHFRIIREHESVLTGLHTQESDVAKMINDDVLSPFATRCRYEASNFTLFEHWRRPCKLQQKFVNIDSLNLSLHTHRLERN